MTNVTEFYIYPTGSTFITPVTNEGTNNTPVWNLEAQISISIVVISNSTLDASHDTVGI